MCTYIRRKLWLKVNFENDYDGPRRKSFPAVRFRNPRTLICRRGKLTSASRIVLPRDSCIFSGYPAGVLLRDGRVRRNVRSDKISRSGNTIIVCTHCVRLYVEISSVKSPRKISMAQSHELYASLRVCILCTILYLVCTMKINML